MIFLEHLAMSPLEIGNDYFMWKWKTSRAPRETLKMVTKQFAMHNSAAGGGGGESCAFNVDKPRREPFYGVLSGVCLE